MAGNPAKVQSKMHKMMRVASFREDQWNHRYDPHVAPINRFVDRLRDEAGSGIPYVAPLHGGTKARALFIFQDPGPGTDRSARGSGFLCSENNDESAALLASCMDTAGLLPDDITPWNAYPWMLPPSQDRPRASQLESGIEPLTQLLAMLPDIRAVALMGRVAQDGWRRFARNHVETAETYLVYHGPHPSRRGITGGGKHSRDEGIAQTVQLMRDIKKAIV